MDIGARLIHRAMDESLDVRRRRMLAHGRAVDQELHDVARFHQFRAARTRQQVTIRMQRMTDTDVTIGIEHAFVGEDPVGDNDIVNALGEGGDGTGHWSSL